MVTGSVADEAAAASAHQHEEHLGERVAAASAHQHDEPSDYIAA